MKLTEAQIERTCSDILAADGWRMLKTNPVSDRARGKGFGEVGMADCLYIRYYFSGRSGERQKARGASEALWIEWKSSTGKPKPHQTAWHEAERVRGALTLIAGVDFPASIEGFADWYKNSRLKRR